MTPRLWNALRDMPSTNFRIFVSVILEVCYVLTLLACIAVGRVINIEAAYMLGGFITLCLGLGAAQFRAKRRSDIRFVSARKPEQTVNVDEPSQVNVTAEDKG